VSRRLFFLALGMFTVGSSSFMIAGLLPGISKSLDQPVSIASQGIAAFSLTYLFSAPLFSLLNGRMSAKRTLQLALATFLLGNLLTLSAHGIGAFVVGRILAGLGAGIFNPACVNLAMGIGAKGGGGAATKGRVLSFIWGANSAGVVFGVPLGIHLASKFDWRVSIGYVFVLALVVLIGLSLQKANAVPPPTSSLRTRLHLLVDKNVLQVLGITCGTALASLGLYSYVSLVQKGVPHSLTASLLCWGVGGFTGSSLVGSLIDRTRQPRSVMALILVGLMVTFLTMPLTHGLPYLSLASFFLWGMFGWAMPTPQSHVLFGFHEDQRAILSALNSSAMGLGSTLGTGIGGLVVASGVEAIHLPILAAALLGGVTVCQMALRMKHPVAPERRGLAA
jgi:predicted MFS family arabinose efflux permease